MKRSGRSSRTGFAASRREIDEFLAPFTEVENCLNRRLGLSANDRTGASTLIAEYARWNPYRADQADQLGLLKDIPNVLVHKQSYDEGYPVILPPRTVHRLKAIHDHLATPVTIGQHYRCPVVTVTPTDSLKAVLSLAYEKGFSQFPVLKDGHFSGLITENAIVRWLGRRVRSSGPAVDLDDVRVGQVTGKEEPERKRSILAFASAGSPEDEVTSLFVKSRLLEVILLTEDGRPTSALAGIVTQWGAARYSP
jgi:CBS domain-containing protein